MGIFIKVIIIAMVVIAAIAISTWCIGTLADKVASERAITVWDLMTHFVLTLFVISMTKNDVYEYFFNHPEQYETPLSAGENGMTIYLFILVLMGFSLAYALITTGHERRADEIRRRRREARERRRRMQ